MIPQNITSISITFSSLHVHRADGSNLCAFSYEGGGRYASNATGSSNTDGCVAIASRSTVCFARLLLVNKLPSVVLSTPFSASARDRSSVSKLGFISPAPSFFFSSAYTMPALLTASGGEVLEAIIEGEGCVMRLLHT